VSFCIKCADWIVILYFYVRFLNRGLRSVSILCMASFLVFCSVAPFTILFFAFKTCKHATLCSSEDTSPSCFDACKNAFVLPSDDLAVMRRYLFLFGLAPCSFIFLAASSSFSGSNPSLSASPNSLVFCAHESPLVYKLCIVDDIQACLLPKNNPQSLKLRSMQLRQELFCHL